MSLCSWKLQLSPGVLLHLLLLLLFADSSLTESQVLSHITTQLNNTQGTICSTGCNNETLINDPNPEDSQKNIPSFGQKNLSTALHSNLSLTVTRDQTNSTSVDGGSEEDGEVKPNRTQQVQLSHNSSLPINFTTVSSNLPSTVAAVSRSKQSTAAPTSPSNQHPTPPTSHPSSEPHPGPATTLTKTSLPIINPVPPTTAVPSTPSMSPTSSPTSTPPSVNRTTIAPAATTTDTQTMLTPPLRTTTPTVPSTSVTAVTASKAALTSNVTSAIVALATKVSVVEVASSALTQQLMDTAVLLAVLVFGLLFFLVTVVVFVTQAYESYRTKDYTQVDYLINGMYTDSGV